MIQFKRGSTSKWHAKDRETLADGQPGYDKKRHKLKIGDGKSTWAQLPFVSGLTKEEVLDSEANAKERLAEDQKDNEDTIAIFTYGTANPDSKTVGEVYLQYYDTDPEIDYVIGCGSNGIWTYQVWKSGLARCWGNYSLTASIKNTFNELEYLYCDTKVMTSGVKYPFTFSSVPVETITVQSTSNIVWAACNTENTESTTGKYNLISPDKCNSATYKLSISVEGHIDIAAWKAKG